MIQIAAAAIFLATIGAVVARPLRLPEWVAASVGALLMIAVGVEPLDDAVRQILTQWNVLLFFAGLSVVIAVAESAGFFAWIAYVSAAAAHGSARRLFFGIIAAGALVTLFLTNDAAALVMTPIVYVLVRRLRLRAAPFAFACAFIANSASIFLPISNPINFMIGDAAGFDLRAYVHYLWAPALVGAIASIVALWLVFRRDVRGRFDEALVKRPDSDERYRIEITYMLAATTVTLITTSALSGLVGVAAVLAAAAMLAHGIARRTLLWRRIAIEANLSIVLFVGALFIVVAGVLHAGLIDGAAAYVVGLARGHQSFAAPLAAFAAAAASNVFNNLPTALVATGMLHSGAIPVATAGRFAAGAIVGCDLGPNLTTVGSLSTLMWLVLLRRRGMQVSAADYFKVGVVIAPIVLASAIAALWFSNR